MVKFRKSKSTDVKVDGAKIPVHIAQKDLASVTPPKKVIKALYDYNAPTDPPHYLSFSQGDFLHVVARENDEDWYEACNPLQGTRGLVPAKYFETVGKTTRDSQGSAQSAPHDSGYSDSTSGKSATPNGSAHGPAHGAAQGPTLGHRMSKSLGKIGGAMVYGVVAYDFKAERPDELDAKEGEAIIVIAQSNPEWFVAKPITRLGGPGLIPVSFIQIKDMITGKTVTDPSEAIAKAGIPKVEEWKKMAADYKNTSIPLGSFGTPQGSVSNVQQGMNRMSLGGQPAPGHVRSQSGYQQPVLPSPAVLYPVRATVPRFVYNDEKFHFMVECSMSNGSHWDLSRIYEDFYELQINLIKAFPDEAGQTGQPRTLPYMPGPVQFVTDKITEGRRENLDEYLQSLLRLGPHVTKSPLVCSFFTPRNGDYEVDPNAIDSAGNPLHAAHSTPVVQSHRFSHASQRSQQQHHHHHHQQQQQQQQQQQYSPQQQYPGTPHQRQLSSAHGPRSGPAHYRNTSELSQNSGSHPPMQRQPTTASASSGGAAAAVGVGALKVKVWFDRETCAVVRMPPKGKFSFDDLYRKVSERRMLEFSPKKDSGLEDNGTGLGNSRGSDPLLEIEYRDERDGEYYKLADDEELATALDTNEKLTLVVREVVS